MKVAFTTKDENGALVILYPCAVRSREVEGFWRYRSSRDSVTGTPRGTTYCRLHQWWRAREGESEQGGRSASGEHEEGKRHVMYARCCGLDVHKRMIAACILLRDPSGEVQQEIRRFGTRTRDLLELVDWRQSQHVTHV